tara:strand:+ start:449 stop:634 length:186 start_codon:yes stop_codon:yes gene_type:complete
MKKNILLVIFIIIGMIAIFNFSDYNLTRTISACVAAKQQTSESFNYEKAKKSCEEKIRKNK